MLDQSGSFVGPVVNELPEPFRFQMNFFAQLIKLKLADAIVTTTGAIEEDIMKASGEKFIIGDFHSDDIALYERGVNRVGNLYITNESYGRFENK